MRTRSLVFVVVAVALFALWSVLSRGVTARETFASLKDARTSVSRQACSAFDGIQRVPGGIVSLVTQKRLAKHRNANPGPKPRPDLVYCSLDDDAGVRLRDPAISYAADACRSFGVGNPMVQEAEVEQVRNVENRVQYDRCVVGLDRGQMTESNMAKFANLLDRFDVCTGARYTYDSSLAELATLSNAYGADVQTASANITELEAELADLAERAKNDDLLTAQLNKRIDELKEYVRSLASRAFDTQSQVQSAISLWQKTLDATRCNINVNYDQYRTCKQFVTPEMVAKSFADINAATRILQDSVKNCEAQILRKAAEATFQLTCSQVSTLDPEFVGVLVDAAQTCPNTCTATIAGTTSSGLTIASTGSGMYLTDKDQTTILPYLEDVSSFLGNTPTFGMLSEIP